MRFDYAVQIKALVPFREAAERYGLSFDRGGFSRCPFHSEKTASFKLWNERQGHCFGCGKTADVLDLTMELLGLDFSSAVERLNADFALGLPVGEKPNLRQRAEAERRLREKRRAEDERKAREERRRALTDRWIALDRSRREYAPKNETEPLHPLFVEALRELEYLSYLIDSEEV